MQTLWYKEWRGHSYALYLRGRSGNWNPYYSIRMLHAIGRVHSYIVVRRAFSSLSLCFFKSNYSKMSFPDLFGKVRNNKLMHLWFGISPPIPLAKVIII